jgi:hypothetical protein
MSESPETTPHPLAGYSRERQIGWDEAMATVRAARATVPVGPLPGQEIGHGCSPECGDCRRKRVAARPVPAAERRYTVDGEPTADYWPATTFPPVPAAEDRERLREWLRLAGADATNEAVVAQIIDRQRRARRVAEHSPHDQSGDPVEGFPSCACGCWDNFNDAARPVLAGHDEGCPAPNHSGPCNNPARPVPAAESHPDPMIAEQWAVPAADDRERLYVALNAEIGDVFGDDLSRERFDRALLRAGVSPSSGDAEHALHFDPDCEECAYLARPTRETLGSPPTGDASLREAAQRVSDKASVIARGGASPRWVVDDATFSALRAALSTGDADRLHEAIRAVYYEDKHPDLSGGLTTDPADARLAAAILRRLG